MTHCFTLSPSMLAAAFPFHLVVDHELRIVQSGDVLQRICADSLIGQQLSYHFQIDRPKIEASYDSIQKRQKSLFSLKRLSDGMQLKGQFILDPDQKLLFFLGSPWITSVEKLAPLNIKLKDFAIHDPIVDFIFLLQATQTSLTETKKLTEELTQQQLQLENTLSVKENLAKIAKSQANRLKETLNYLQKTQAQLVQTEKMSSLGQMVAGVAHEINNPVNFIHANLEHVTGYTQDLLKLVALYQKNSACNDAQIVNFSDEIDLDFLMEDFPKMVSSMKIGTRRIREIVASLRNFSRLDEAEQKRVDIHSGLESTLLILKHRLENTNIEVYKEYGELPEIECYAGQLNQVFMNLISNSIDSLIDGKRQDLRFSENHRHPDIIHITTTTNGDQILIKISDNGSGISQSVKSRLFDPFFTTKAVGKGTGLGLSISYQIVVEKHGGNLWCESSPGQGATFYIQLSQQLSRIQKDKDLIDFKELAQVL